MPSCIPNFSTWLIDWSLATLTGYTMPPHDPNDDEIVARHKPTCEERSKRTNAQKPAKRPLRDRRARAVQSVQGCDNLGQRRREGRMAEHWSWPVDVANLLVDTQHRVAMRAYVRLLGMMWMRGACPNKGEFARIAAWPPAAPLRLGSPARG